LPLLQTDPFGTLLYAEGLMTHLADADSDDPHFTALQLERFGAVVHRLEAAGLRIPLIHAANSAGILRHPRSHFSLVRPGIMLYGYQAARLDDPSSPLTPVLSLATRVVQVRNVDPGDSVSYNRLFIASRPSRIAVLPIGYADGYSRLLSNRGFVLIRGQRVPIAGRVCMDMTMVDATHLPEIVPGDEAVLIGRQGAECISAADLAAWLDTIPYEILCAIGPRVVRSYR
jgi:alanine racemase